MLPLTPQTGSEASGSSGSGSGILENKKNAKELRKRSVSFVEPENLEKRAKGVHRREGSEAHEDPAEDKRKERRRSEAKAAIEVHISAVENLMIGLTLVLNSSARLLMDLRQLSSLRRRDNPSTPVQWPCPLIKAL